jgi:ribosomal protein S18 acetylase RimI-like enzyme
MLMEDYNQVYRLWTNTEGMGLRQFDDSYEGIERFLKRNPRTNYVAEADNEIIGVILGGHDGRRGHIYHTAVRIDYRGKGIGKALVSEVLSSMQKEAINKVALVVFTANETGNRFWQSIGFTERNDLIYRDLTIPIRA